MAAGTAGAGTGGMAIMTGTAAMATGMEAAMVAGIGPVAMAVMVAGADTGTELRCFVRMRG